MNNRKLLIILFFTLSICLTVLAKSLQLLNELFTFSYLISFNLNEFNELFSKSGIIFLIMSFTVFSISKLIKKENSNVIDLKTAVKAFSIVGFFVFTGGI